MDKYEIMLYPRAYRDIHDIYAYIALEKLSPGNCKRTDGSDLAGNKKAGTVSKIAPGPSGRPLCGKEYKQLIIEQLYCYFKVDENKKKVFVLTCNIREGRCKRKG